MVTSSPLYLDYSLPSCDFYGTNCKIRMPFKKVLAIGQSKWRGQHVGTLGLLLPAQLLAWCLRLATSKLGWNYWKCWAKFNFSMQLDSICQEPTCFSHLGLHVFPSQFSENYLHTGPAAASLKRVWANRKTFEHTCKFLFLLEPFPHVAFSLW